MSKTAKTTQPENGKTLDERIAELEEIRDELEIIAASDVPYAAHARRFLAALEEVDDA